MAKRKKVDPAFVELEEVDRQFVRKVLSGHSLDNAYMLTHGLNNPDIQALTPKQLENRAKERYERKDVQSFLELLQKPAQEQALIALKREMHFGEDESIRKKAAEKLMSSNQKDVKTAADMWLEIMRSSGAEVVKPCDCGGASIAKMSEFKHGNA